jgi:hypothetical protein
MIFMLNNYKLILTNILKKENIKSIFSVIILLYHNIKININKNQ